MDIALPPADDHRPDAEVLHPLQAACRLFLHDRAAFDDRFLIVLARLLPPNHPLREAPGLALDLLDVVLGAVLAGQPPERTEAECQDCGERCAAAGLPDDVYPIVGRAVARAARDSAGESWSSIMSSGWAAVHRWVVGHLLAGAWRGRTRGEVWHSFPELAPSSVVGPPPDLPSPCCDVPGSDAESEWALLEQAALSSADAPSADCTDDPGPARLLRDRRALRRRSKPA